MKSRRVTFEGSLGHELGARVDLGDGAGAGSGEPAAWALFAHCFTCSKDLKAVGRVSKALVDRGFGVLRFDFTGLGDSQGDFADTNFSTNLDDLRAAVAWLRSEHAAPSLLVGHSLGGAAVLSMAGEVEECRAVATFGAPATTEHVRDLLVEQAPELSESDPSDDSVVVRLAGRRFRIQRQMIDDLESHRVLDAVSKLGKPLLVCHSPVDDTVGIDHARRIFEAAKHPKSFLSLDDADHLLMRDPQDAIWLADVLSAWAGRYLALDPGADALTGPEAVAGRTTSPDLDHGQVEVRGGDGLVQDIVTGDGHRLVADEPEKLGGTDRGATPYDLLLASLGTCTNMTLRMYANRKGWPLDGVTTRLAHGRIHAKDCDDCVQQEGMISEITRTVEVHGDALDDAQVERLMEIADRCPVHRTLSHDIKIRTQGGREAHE